MDCLTDRWAVEFDFADNWAECIGQSLHYSMLTNRPPACALILEKETDAKYLKILENVAEKHSIKVFIIKNLE